MKKKKIPKKAQVAFNQFIFDELMNKMRGIELLESRIAKLEGSNYVSDAATSGSFKSLFPRVEKLEKELKDQREDYHAHIRQLVEENETAHKKLSAELSQVASDTNKVLISHKQIMDVAREASNRQAAVITRLDTQMRNLLPQLNGVCNRVLKMERPWDYHGRFNKKV